MSLFSKIKQKVFCEIIDSVEWIEDDTDIMIWRFPRYQAEIKNGAQLTVRINQVAVLVNKGQFADVYQPGHYELTTTNMPILTALRGWKYGFNSAFKVDVYFVNTKPFLNLCWNTTDPILMYDREFGPIHLRTFGSYCFRIESNPIKFIRNVAGTDWDFTTESVTEQVQNFVTAKFADYLVDSKIAALDLVANLNEFSNELNIALKDDFFEYGIEHTMFLIEKVSLPEAVEEALGKRIRKGVIGNMTTYKQMQFAESLKDAANKLAGGAIINGDSMGADTSLTMGGETAQQMTNPRNRQVSECQSKVKRVHNPFGDNHQHTSPPPMPSQQMYHVAVRGVQKGPFSIAQLQQMVKQGRLNPDTLVWTAGMAGWVVANSEFALSQLFGAVPPPL
ncbi:MAG: SPFH domain-containing protein [Salinivirgaceae bacterium]|nr:SPFH domain-containing protein [Salinivirgaceae bacterium]